MSTLAVVSTPKQYQELADADLLENLTIFCDNERCYDYLTTHDIKFTKLNEYILKGHWKNGSAWACAAASGWIKFCKNKNIFPLFDVPSCLYLYFSTTLMMALKNHFYVRHILEKHTPSKVILFDSQTSFVYPDFSSNVFLNYFLGIQCKINKIPTQKIQTQEKLDQVYFNPRSKLKQSLIRTIRHLLQRLYGAVVRPQKTDVLAFGSLRHLSAPLAELSRQGIRCSLYDSEFHQNLFVFATQKKIPYLTPENFPHKHFKEYEGLTNLFSSQILQGFREAAREGFFIYDSFDFSEFLVEIVAPTMGPYCARLQEKAHHYKNIVKTLNPQAVLVEEDFHSRAFFVAFMRAHGVKTFCISHANTTFDFSVSAESRALAQSTTFVHSEHEKKAHADLGWDPGHIHVVGTPRYDRIAGMIKNRSPRNPSSPKRILFPGAFLEPFSPDAMGYLGVEMNGFREVQLRTFTALEESIRGLPVEILIKPHHVENEPLWRDHIRTLKLSNRVHLAKHSDDFISLLLQCDLMVIPNWSSTLIEAAICNVPIIYADLANQGNSAISDYAAAGFCLIARDLSEMRILIRDILFSKVLRRPKDALPRHKEFYLGKNDGLGTYRVVDIIRGQLDATSSDL